MNTYISTSTAYMQFLCHMLGYTPSVNAQCILCIDIAKERPIAGVVFDAYNGQVVMAHIWVDEGVKPSRDWFAAIFDYPFNRMLVHKIVGQVKSSNLEAIKLDEHLGFVLECKVTEFYDTGADLLVYTMTKEQCHILNSPVWAPVLQRVMRA